MMLQVTRVLILAVLLSLGISVVYAAAPTKFKYPGSDDQGQVRIEYGASLIRNAIERYYRLTGAWPQQWQDVVQSGIIQVPVYGYGGEVINPDDDRIDFSGDVVYKGSETPTDEAVSVYYSSAKYGQTSVGKAYRQQTYREANNESQTIIEQSGLKDTADFIDYNEVTSDPGMMKQLATLGLIADCLSMYDMIYGHFPYCWQDFLDSGLSPVDIHSINPRTGQPFHYDGSALDIWYHYDDSNEPAYSWGWTEKSGMKRSCMWY
jgi:hypothetical protein